VLSQTSVFICPPFAICWQLEAARFLLLFLRPARAFFFFYFVYLFFLLRFSFCRRLRRAVNEVNLALSHASLLLTFARRARSPLLTSVILRCCWPKRAKVPTSEAKRLRFKNKYIYSYIFLRFSWSELELGF